MFSCSMIPSRQNELPLQQQITIDDKLRATLKQGYVTRLVPTEAYGYAAHVPLHPPQLGDLVLTQVKMLKGHSRIEAINGRQTRLFRNDLLIGVYGNCYATQQYEGLVPNTTKTCQLLDATGICGIVRSKHTSAQAPTELNVVGFVHSPAGIVLNLINFGLPPVTEAVPSTATRGDEPLVIAVVGSATRSGKTTTAVSLISGLVRLGYRVAAAKLTGTATSIERWLYREHEAAEMLDFLDCGFPSTYLCSEAELLNIYRTLYHTLAQQKPDVIVLELGDGIVQRETNLLLRHPEICASIDGVLYAVADSLAAESGVRWLQVHGYRMLGISGLVSASPLAAHEAEAFSGIHCYTREELLFSALDIQPS